MYLSFILPALMSLSLLIVQDTPTDIPKSELPKTAVCAVCEANGEGHASEKPAAGVRYKGKTYYFCNAKEVPEFKKDPEAYTPPVLPRPAPDMTLKTLDGDSAKLSDYRGKAVLIDFWATWCKPCVKAMPDLMKLHAKYAEKGFSVIGVAIDGNEGKAVQPFVEKRKVSYPVLLDAAKQWEQWKVRAIPASFLIDPEGRIVRQWVGEVKPKDWEQAVESVLPKTAKP